MATASRSRIPAFRSAEEPVGVDANGDGRVDSQDIGATVRRVFFGG